MSNYNKRQKKRGLLAAKLEVGQWLAELAGVGIDDEKDEGR